MRSADTRSSMRSMQSSMGDVYINRKVWRAKEMMEMRWSTCNAGRMTKSKAVVESRRLDQGKRVEDEGIDADKWEMMPSSMKTQNDE